MVTAFKIFKHHVDILVRLINFINPNYVILLHSAQNVNF